eukprot:TRINITY_DN51866_c0_g1_i17.p1 TRINITY_DN51866_c0_g1~~TRINITY_DN51866_c0_g1_i17.p1  ORF type:complete len:160 (+),score=18.87 TRINITY_DN51866_c0_g1_i17:356-835(+)
MHSVCLKSVTLSSIYAGDSNIHFDRPADTTTSKVIDLLDSYGPVQSVRVPTHIRGHTLDGIVHRADQAILKSVVADNTLPPYHVCLVCNILLSRPTPRQSYVLTRHLSAVDRTAFDVDLQSRLAALPPTTPDELNNLLGLLDQHVPSTTHLVSKQHSSP